MSKKTSIVLVVVLAIIIIILIWLNLFTNKKTPNTQQPTDNQNTQLTNPASTNCVDKGGTLSIVKRGDGGEYGICYFQDNRQCEEWALLRGDCPVGGLKVTGYITPAAQYCVITGGTYTITDATVDPEKGICDFKDGSSCDTQDYYNGGLCGK